MKISLDWLRDFVTWEESPAELAEKLTCLGLNVEGVAEYMVSFPKVVVAEVREVKPHPNADRLSLCSLYDGAESFTVVCGAPNVRSGLKVLLAKVGAQLPGGLCLKKTKIRGIESQGMICSASELELGTDAAGIIELPDDNIPGTPADDLIGFRDTVLDIEVTPNRPDWLSHLGVAREVAALSGTKISLPPVWTEQPSGGEQLEISVEIEDFGDCPRYTAHGARKIRVGPAPTFIRNRLRAIGSRSINNIVDITNYVMFEMGQPLHAFDRKKLNGSRIFVRRARQDEIVRTLDGQERKLQPRHLIIADGAGVVAVAGVIGGEGSQVDNETDEIVLESAFFDPLGIRRTRSDLGIVTDSSYRFEREADWGMVDMAAKRTLYLLQKYTDALILADWVDRQNPDRRPPPEVPLRVSQVNRLLGSDLDSAEVVRLLQQLSLQVKPLGRASDRDSAAASMMVEVPSYRRDLKMEVDLIEEVARMHGYDQVSGLGSFRGGPGNCRRLNDRVVASIRGYFATSGYFEVTTSSFWEEQDPDRLDLDPTDPRRQCLRIANPRHGGEILLRTSLLPSLLRAARHNIHADNPLPIKLFQINKVFWPAAAGTHTGRHADEKLLPAEPVFLQFGIAGSRESGLGEVPADILEVKGVLDTLSRLLRIPLTTKTGGEEPFLVGGGQWSILDRYGQVVGHAGAVSPRVRHAFDLDCAVAVAELAYSKLDLSPSDAKFQPFSRFPAVKRDLSLLVPEGVKYLDLQDVVKEGGGDLLESLELFDFYRGKEIDESAAAVGIRLKFRSDRGNLKGKTVDKTIEKIQDALSERLDVRLRG